MDNAQLDRLKKILSIPTYFKEEHDLLRHLVAYLKTTDYVFDIDDFGNLYITKGNADVFPCVCAHTDSVHEHTDIEIHEMTVENEQRLIGRRISTGYQCGIGADDKAGVFICMELLEIMPTIKVALFSGEEYGCVGSQNSDMKFFENVGYIIEFDCPGSTGITHYCNGLELFQKDGEFYTTIKPILTEQMGTEPILYRHPYTDVWALKRQHPISCINIATGYEKYHMSSEYVVVKNVLNAITIGQKCIEKLGNKIYPFRNGVNESLKYNRYQKLPPILEKEKQSYKNILTD